MISGITGDVQGRLAPRCLLITLADARLDGSPVHRVPLQAVGDLRLLQADNAELRAALAAERGGS
jgi:hypothetical protein